MFLRASILLFAALFCTSFVHGITTETGKTVMNHPVLANLLEPVYGQFRDFAARNEVADRFTLTAAPFYIESANPKNLRRNFMPEGKDELVIKGGDLPTPRDVSATWLKIAGTSAAGDDFALMHNAFSSRLTVEPRYSMYGAAFGLHKKIGSVFIQATVPLAEVQANLGVKEFIEGGNVESIDNVNLYDPAGGGGMVENPNILYSVSAAEAFGKEYWKYNKLSSSPLKASGIGDVALRVGLDGAFGELFLCCVVPTSKRPTNAYIFEPLLGNGSHFGLGAGGALKLGKHLDFLNAQFSLRGEFDYTYLFENDQVRTFDLADRGSLSRYLLFKPDYAGNASLASYPGVNILSKKCSVSPQGTVHLGVLCGLQQGKIRGSLQYQLAHQQQERIRVKENFDKRYDISHSSGSDAAAAALEFYHAATISTHGDDQAMLGFFIAPLTIDRLDLASATRPSSTVSSGVLSLGFEEMWHGSAVGINLFSGINFDHVPQRLCSWILGLQSSVNF